MTSFLGLPKSSLEIRVDKGEVFPGKGSIDGVDKPTNETLPKEALPTESSTNTPV